MTRASTKPAFDPDTAFDPDALPAVPSRGATVPVAPSAGAAWTPVDG